MKENDRGKLAVAPPKRKDDSPSISRETARSFFVALCLCVRKKPGVFYTFAARIMPPAVA